MVAKTGFVVRDTYRGYADLGYISDDLDSYTPAWINSLKPWAAAPIPGITTLAANYPVSTTPLPRVGFVAHSYFDDYYNRIHVVPRVLDIGNLLSVQTRQAVVWNAYLTSQALASIDEDETVGLTESGITAPSTFAPLQESTFNVTVDTEGPASIDALYTFNFPAESPTLSVIGRRVVVFGYAPNWTEPVRERLSWLTDVLPAIAGTEQRIGLRGVPRRAMEYEFVARDRTESIRLETMLLGWQSRLLAVPVWTDMQSIASTLPAGSTSISCTTTVYEFAANGLLVLWRGPHDYEAVEIASVGAGSLTLKSPTLATWPAGTRIYPVRLGRMQERQKLVRETNHHITGKMVFNFIDHPGVTAADSGDTFAGYRVYLGRTDWAEPVEVEALRQLEVLDYETGAAWVDDISGLAALLKSWHWTMGTRAEVVALRAWLHARAGRLMPFWSPTQGDDIEVLAPIGSSDTAITIRNMGYKRYIDGRVDRRHIAIETKAGTRYYRTITAASEIDDETETLAIDSALGATVQVADIKRVRFMHLVRLDSDDVEIEWYSDQIARCSTMLRSLPA